MYLQQELRELRASRQSEGLARIHALHSLMQGYPGFRRTLACRYLENFTQYMWLRFWDSSEQQAAFRRSPEAQAFSSTRPEGLYWPLPGGVAPGLDWELVLASEQAPASGRFLARFAFVAAGDRKAEFLNYRRKHDELALERPGITSTVTYRCLDPSSRDTYITLVWMEELESYRRFLEVPAVAELLASAPDGFSKALTTECYEVLEELAPTPV